MAGKTLETVYCCEGRYGELKIYYASSARGAMMVEIRLSGQEDCLAYFSDIFSGIRLMESQTINAPLVDAVRAALENRPMPEHIPLDLSATSFQRAAWNAIASIPYGATRTYSEVAQMMGRPLAARAVGQAMGKNPLPLFFP